MIMIAGKVSSISDLTNYTFVTITDSSLDGVEIKLTFHKDDERINQFQHRKSMLVEISSVLEPCPPLIETKS